MYNFGLHVADYDAPEVHGFLRREPLNFAAAQKAAGFVGRSGYRGEPGPRSWGPQIFPRFLKGSGRDSGPSSLSLWENIESLMAFAYAGVHAEALKNARNWNTKNTWPPLVLWWVEAGRRPDWEQGARKLEWLHDHGAGPEAFTFKQPFGADGEPLIIDRARVKTLAEANSPGQRDLLAQLEHMPV
ncbi:hypothetical protein LL06_07945 [Hoeflea sp. BAL378]|uniref:DUF3291 domain-containing protein n=1 Tax=Hoeflea sp. BAL378 TaxID=1547437 RepID=UPI0005134D5E|nr:DUF3291 domain-containing protein [Hoeflea sp. BAL378]KGF69974.1 hypothetical protein LL06_07945 [Hoeflea sp. BAL378]